MHDWDAVYTHGIGQIVKDDGIAYCKACDVKLSPGKGIEKHMELIKLDIYYCT